MPWRYPHADGRKGHRRQQEFEAQFIALEPAGGMGTPEEVAEAVVWLWLRCGFVCHGSSDGRGWRTGLTIVAEIGRAES